MNQIRVHLGEMPRMLRTMISDLLTAEPDMTVVGNTFADGDSLQAASAEGADILIAQDRASAPDSCMAAVISGVPAAILAVATDGKDGICVNLVRRPVNFDGNGSSLAKAVRHLLSSPASLNLRNQNTREA